MGKNENTEKTVDMGLPISFRYSTVWYIPCYYGILVVFCYLVFLTLPNGTDELWSNLSIVWKIFVLNPYFHPKQSE